MSSWGLNLYAKNHVRFADGMTGTGLCRVSFVSREFVKVSGEIEAHIHSQSTPSVWLHTSKFTSTSVLMWTQWNEIVGKSLRIFFCSYDAADGTPVVRRMSEEPKKTTLIGSYAKKQILRHELNLLFTMNGTQATKIVDDKKINADLNNKTKKKGEKKRQRVIKTSHSFPLREIYFSFLFVWPLLCAHSTLFAHARVRVCSIHLVRLVVSICAPTGDLLFVSYVYTHICLLAFIILLARNTYGNV